MKQLYTVMSVLFQNTVP